jgi:hypothetical protein
MLVDTSCEVPHLGFDRVCRSSRVRARHCWTKWSKEEIPMIDSINGLRRGHQVIVHTIGSALPSRFYF